MCVCLVGFVFSSFFILSKKIDGNRNYLFFIAPTYLIVTQFHHQSSLYYTSFSPLFFSLSLTHFNPLFSTQFNQTFLQPSISTHLSLTHPPQLSPLSLIHLNLPTHQINNLLKRFKYLSLYFDKLIVCHREESQVGEML